MVPAPAHALRVPAADRWVATQPGPIVMAEVPVPDIGNAGRFERYQAAALAATSALRLVHEAAEGRVYEVLPAR